MGATEWALLLILSVLWGGSFFFAKVALAELSPLKIVLSRVMLAAVTLYAVVRIMGLSMAVGTKMWAAFFGMGVLNNLIPFSLIFWGQTQISSGLASILNATTPLFAVMVAHVWGESERLTALRVLGVLAGLVGVAILMGPDALSGLGGNLLPQLAVLAAAMSYGCAGLYGRRFRALPPLVTATGQVTATSLMLFPVMLLSGQLSNLTMPSQTTIGAILGLALISTALAYAIFFRIMQKAGGTNVGLVTFLIPVSAILLGSTFLGETLLPRHIWGMVAIMMGLALIDGRIVPKRLVARLQRSN
ncbi:MAG: DMT family transporter [Bosea sp. (in: a-proteobacteria)]